MAEIEQGVLKLGRVEGIDTAEELLAKLRAIADESEAAKIDGSAVISVDSTTLQMLVVLHRELTQEGSNMSWVDASAKLKKSATMLGLAQELGL
ncbi:MAG: STAS domain-containing protein [Halieaceae bacterium]|jgi:anti-anti-sigma regulatory factor|nr:STAS domain-containing protein [Halieaceae bacterium]